MKFVGKDEVARTRALRAASPILQKTLWFSPERTCQRFPLSVSVIVPGTFRKPRLAILGNLAVTHGERGQFPIVRLPLPINRRRIAECGTPSSDRGTQMAGCGWQSVDSGKTGNGPRPTDHSPDLGCHIRVVPACPRPRQGRRRRSQRQGEQWNDQQSWQARQPGCRPGAGNRSWPRSVVMSKVCLNTV